MMVLDRLPAVVSIRGVTRVLVQCAGRSKNCTVQRKVMLLKKARIDSACLSRSDERIIPERT